MKKLLFIYPTLSSFIIRDIHLLKENFEVSEFHFDVKSKNKLPQTLWKQAIFLLKNLRKCDAVICRFGGYHSVLPVILSHIFRRKSFVIIGGNEGHYFPSFGYGNATKKGLSQVTYLTLKWCHLILPVHRSLIEHNYTYSNLYPSKQGIKNIWKIKTPWREIYNGFDSDLFNFNEKESTIKGTFCTVINNADLTAWELKGLDLIAEAAKQLPQFQFTVVAVFTEETATKLSQIPNLNLIKNKTQKELSQFLSTQQFYLQLSVAEGFPNALCEAMLCGCFPIVSNVFSMPFIVGKEGYILHRKNSKELVLLLQRAYDLYENESRNKIRNTIKQKFTLEKRQKQLHDAIMIGVKEL